MRNRFDEQLEKLNVELIRMGALCEDVISQAAKALETPTDEFRQIVYDTDHEIDRKERDIESLCMRLLLQQQPVASDLRLISSALKMISDMERIGDQAADIAEMTTHLEGDGMDSQLHIAEMARATIKMVTDSVDSFVRRDLDLARSVQAYDDVVDGLFNRVKTEIIELIARDSASGEDCVDLLMIAKYFERIGDHAVNIADWADGGTVPGKETDCFMIYLVEDDDSIRELVVYTLRTTGFEAKGFSTAALFWEAVEEEQPELVLLDIMLPDEDGLHILKRLRSNAETADLPVIMLTAKSTEYDRVLGLDSGADDYIPKPFGMMELVSRIKALLRRASRQNDEKIYNLDALYVDVKRHNVAVNGQEISLTYKEFELLCYLLENRGVVLTRDQILSKIWDYNYSGETRTVDVHIRTLRQKLGAMGALIETVRGVGYRIAEKAPKPADGGDNEA